MKLRKVGFFRDAMYDKELIYSIREQALKEEDENNGKIIRYLNEGHLLVTSPTIIKDIFNPENIIGSASILTDGVWMWPREFAFYISKYNVKVPPEFIHHMKNNGWNVPEKIDIANFIPSGD